MVWIDMKQPGEDPKNGDAALGQEEGDALLKKEGKSHENWWPGMRRWHLGMICENGTLELGEPEVLNG